MGVPQDLALAVAKVESGFQAEAHSNKGARGIMQIMPATAWEWYGLPAAELWDPETNIRTGVRHLSDLYASLGSWDLVLVGYYAGPGVARAGMSRASADVRRYVAAVQSNRSGFADKAIEIPVASTSPAPKVESQTAVQEPGLTDRPAEIAVARLPASVEVADARPAELAPRIQAVRYRSAEAALLSGSAYPASNQVKRIWAAMDQW